MKGLKIIFATVVLSFSSSIFALPNIDGNWTCKGYDPMQKQNFSVSGDIKKSGDVYTFTNWKVAGSNEVRSAVGIHNDKIKDSLAVMFWANDDAEKVGFGIYQVTENKIVGPWTIKNGTVTAEETCERTKA